MNPNPDHAEIFLSEDAAKDRARLDDTQDGKLLWHADKLKEDVTHGDQIPRARIPKRLSRSYDATNLWRLELPGGWRALYTIMTRPEEATTVSILRILDHTEYDRLLGYSTS